MPDDLTFTPVDHDPFAVPKPGQVVPPADVGQAAKALPGQIAGAAWNASGLSDVADTIGRGGTWTDVLGAAIPAAMGALQPEGRVAGKVVEAAAEAAPAIERGITAYHGSPYDFDKFDLSKIGTGEGAQAYGHGLYFAGNEATAQTYKNAPRVTDMDWPVAGTDYTLPAWVARSAQTPQGLEDVRNNFLGRIKESQTEHAAGDWNAAGRVYNQQRIVDALDAVKGGAELQKPGKMYQVNIAADPEHFLDWDKPLSEQHPAIADKVTKAFGAETPTLVGQAENGRWLTLNENGGVIGRPDGWPDRGTAEEAAKVLSQDAQRMFVKTPGELLKTNSQAVNMDRTEKLRQAGIPGIKYLDQGSRATSKDSGAVQIGTDQVPGGWRARLKMEGPPTGTSVSPEQIFTLGPTFKTKAEADAWAEKETSTPGTRNYVVFNDKIVDIIKKYGIAGLIGSGAAHFSMTPVEDDPFQQKRQHGGRVNAANIDHQPTEAQKKAGNYAKDHICVHGLDIAIENAKGHQRSGVDKGGKPWSVTMPAHYGYLKRTEGKDGDHVDVYLGPHLKSAHVFVVDQLNADTGKFDEHKTFIGFPSKQAVIRCYHKAFSDGKAHLRLGQITEMPVDQFKHWLERGDTTKPLHQEQQKAKLPHASVAYVPQSRIKDKRCGLCSMFVADGPHCALVVDPIRAEGYCKRFDRKK